VTDETRYVIVLAKQFEQAETIALVDCEVRDRLASRKDNELRTTDGEVWLLVSSSDAMQRLRGRRPVVKIVRTYAFDDPRWIRDAMVELGQLFPDAERVVL